MDASLYGGKNARGEKRDDSPTPKTRGHAIDTRGENERERGHEKKETPYLGKRDATEERPNW